MTLATPPSPLPRPLSLATPPSPSLRPLHACCAPLVQVIATFNEGARAANAGEVGRVRLVLLDGLSKKSDAEWVGRTDGNRRVVLARRPLPSSLRPLLAQEAAQEAAPGAAAVEAAAPAVEAAAAAVEAVEAAEAVAPAVEAAGGSGLEEVELRPGDYVAVRVTEVRVRVRVRVRVMV